MSANWPQLKLGDVAEKIAMGPFGSSIKVETFVDDGVPVISGAHLHGVKLLDCGYRFVTEEHADKLKNANVFRGDVIFTHAGTIGQVSYIPENSFYDRYVISQRQFYLRSDRTRLLPEYVTYYFKSHIGRSQLLANASQVGVPSIARPSSYLKQLSIPVPSLAEQERIVEVLSALDNKIELNRRLGDTLEAIAQALFQSWFVDFDPVRAKASGEAPDAICQRLGLTPELLALFPDRLVESESGERPEGWTLTSVGEVANVVKGKSYKSNELAPSSVALVTLKSFNRGGGYRLDGLKEYTGSYKPEQRVSAGDLIVAYTDVTQAADVIGKPALVISDDRYETLVISLDVAVIRPHVPEVRWFLYGLMSGQSFQQHTRAYTTGTTVLHLAANAVSSFRLPFPTAALVDAYALVAEPLFQLIDDRVAQSRCLEDFRTALLPKLLTGAIQIPMEDAA